VLRKWLARQLREHSRDQYTVPQEEEIDEKHKPDLRIEAPGMNPISVEIKWAENWSLEKLEERLTNQLVGQYLRAVSSTYGIYLLGYIGKKNNKKHWKNVNTGVTISVYELEQFFQELADNIVTQREDINGLKVFFIDFTKPTDCERK